MRAVRSLVISSVAVAVFTAISLTDELLAQNAPKSDASTQTTKVFRLTRTDPAEVQQVMSELLEFIPVPQTAAPQPQPMGMGMLGIGGGSGGPPAFSTAVDPRTKSVIVRGTDKHIQLATDLVAVLDLPKDKPVPEVNSLRAVTLKHASPQAISEVIENLNLDARLVALPAAKMVVFTGSAKVMKEITDVIKELDVPAEPEPKKETQKRLISDDTEPKQ